MAKSGPKPKGEYHNKSATMTTRITEDLRSALNVAMKKSARSLSQEIEYRLRRSFDDDRKIEDIFGSRENYAVARLIGCVLDSHSHMNEWTSDEENFEYILASVVLTLRFLMGPRSLRPGLVEIKNGSVDRMEMAALVTARFIAAAVVDAQPGVPTAVEDPAPAIRADLSGDAIERLAELAGAKPEFVEQPEEGSA